MRKRHAWKDPPERQARPRLRRSRVYRKMPDLQRPVTLGEYLSFRR